MCGENDVQRARGAGAGGLFIVIMGKPRTPGLVGTVGESRETHLI